MYDANYIRMCIYFCVYTGGVSLVSGSLPRCLMPPSPSLTTHPADTYEFIKHKPLRCTFIFSANIAFNKIHPIWCLLDLEYTLKSPLPALIAGHDWWVTANEKRPPNLRKTYREYRTEENVPLDLFPMISHYSGFY